MRRPPFWAHAVALTLRKFGNHRDTSAEQAEAKAWAEGRSVSVAVALDSIGLSSDGERLPEFPEELRAEGAALASRAPISMGGPGDMQLLYAATIRSRARRVVETGVAYGWSSLALLAGLEMNRDGRLISVDMPYPKMNNESWVGIAVPARFRASWTVVREPDRFGLKKALAAFENTIDLCHYDSDKSVQGRAYAYPLLWNALKAGGIFISDDIQDNLAFRDFVHERAVPFAVTEFQGKYVGIARKR